MCLAPHADSYDTDVTTWSPQGRLFQVEYAMEAVKQGSACVGVTSKTHVVLAGIKRSPGELASSIQKMFLIDEHMGITISGLTADARSLCKCGERHRCGTGLARSQACPPRSPPVALAPARRYMRSECLNHKFVYGSTMQTERLIADVADKHQRATQTYVRRPYGVGLLVAGYDRTGPHLFQTSPDGNYYEWRAMALGARSQSAKTYLERRFETFTEREWWARWAGAPPVQAHDATCSGT